MATMTPTLRPLACWKSLIRHSRQQKTISRTLSTYRSGPAAASNSTEFASQPSTTRHIRTFPPPKGPAQIFKSPIADLHAAQIAVLDPTSSRTQLFSKTNPDAARLGDILLVRQKNGDPFAGVCINIRRRGVESAILLRNELTRVGVEMWYKIYSPNVEGIEVVQRKEKRARRARLTYMRKPKHDVGSVQNIVLAYNRARSAARGGAAERGGNAKGNKKKNKKR